MQVLQENLAQSEEQAKDFDEKLQKSHAEMDKATQLIIKLAGEIEGHKKHNEEIQSKNNEYNANDLQLYNAIE